MQINLLTYNILFGAEKEVFDSLEKTKVDHEDGDLNLFCLQECRSSDIVPNIVDYTNQAYGGYYLESHFDTRLTRDNLGLATYSNLKPIQVDKINFPKVKKSYLNVQTYFLEDYPQYGALITYYMLNHKLIRLTNLHLDVAGGYKQHKIQLTYLFEQLKLNNPDFDIICGDFNTIGFRGKYLEKFPEEIEFIRSKNKLYNVVKSGYTSDIQNAFNPSIPFHKLMHSLPKLGIKLSQRLDWIVYSGLEELDSGVMYNLKGSDHYPLWAKFKF